MAGQNTSFLNHNMGTTGFNPTSSPSCNTKWLLVQIFHNNISPNDRGRLDQFAHFRFNSLSEEEGWNHIKEYVQYQDDSWSDPPPPMNVSSVSEIIEPTLEGWLRKLKKQKKDDDDERLLSIFRPIHINLPFLEAMIHMPKGAKEGDPGSFTLPCLIRPLAVKNALANLGLADRSVKYPIGVCKNLLVKINKFIFPVDFVVLEIDEGELHPIILGGPFLATTHTVIDVHKGKLSLRVRNETITFNIEQWVDTVDHDGKWANAKEEKNLEEIWTVLFYPKHEPIEPLE
ncbi:DNA-directed DNA polymerase [Tanacetum coccineum]